MWQFFAMLALVLGGASYFFWDQNIQLQKNIAAQQIAIEEQKAAFETLQKESKKQQQAMAVLNSRSKSIQNEMNQYMDIFKRHKLPKLAAAKPGMIEKRANDATKAIFDTIEADSRDIDILDDGVQLTGGKLASPVEEAAPGDNNSSKTSTGGDTAADSATGT
jgi:seryl-tRNA synthetase